MESIYARSVVEYCERIGNGLFSEPINLLSNIAFLFSAFFIFKIFKKSGQKGIGDWILFALILLIGTGSALWHSLRTPFTHALDAVPIYLFLITFLFLLLKSLTGSINKSLSGILAFLLLQISVSIFLPEILNGSIRHVVNASLFILLNLWIFKKTKGLNIDFVFTILIYILGIVFRTADNTVCSEFPLGTHFLWHICTATTTYFAVKGLVKLKSND